MSAKGLPLLVKLHVGTYRGSTRKKKRPFSFSLILVYPAITDNNINYKCHNSILYIILIGIWS